jgi:FkbM family methyltransferase
MPRWFLCPGFNGTSNKHPEQDNGKFALLKSKCNHPHKNQFDHQGSSVTPCNCSLGWGPAAAAGAITNGQNLEDGLIFTRFFSGSSPTAHLGQGNGNGQQVGGVYLEMGALDGVTFSNTRLFEYCAGWDGLLIEAQPNNVKGLYKNRPCAVIIPEGVSSDTADGSPSTICMSMHEGTTFDFSTQESSENMEGVNVPCRPLSAMLEEYGVTKINFFFLDVEHAKLKVLETFDFDKVKIDVLMVEADFIHQQGGLLDSNSIAIKGKVEAVRTLVETRSKLKRVPYHLDEGDAGQRFCERVGCIVGSDVVVSPELYKYYTKVWPFGG